VPTYEWLPRFSLDLDKLGPSQRAAFQASVRQFVEDLQRGTFRPGLRVKGVHGARGVYEMTWAADGRATFHYGQPRVRGQAHIVWRRIGTHDIFGRP
jgi:hypothetical protein